MIKTIKRLFGYVPVPTTPDLYEALVDLVVSKYALTERSHAAAVISAQIAHLDASTGYVKLSYLGHSVRKNIANQICFHKSQAIKHSAQITQLKNILETDPNNQQARDELEKAAGEGSIPAKLALEDLAQKNPETTLLGGNVVSLQTN